VQAFQVGADDRPGLGGGGLGDADQQQGQPAEQDVGVDAVFEVVVDRRRSRVGFMSGQPRVPRHVQLDVLADPQPGGTAPLSHPGRLATLRRWIDRHPPARRAIRPGRSWGGP